MRKNYINCFYPVQLINKYDHKPFLANCGHCPACVGVRHQKYVGMMHEEEKSNRYAFFGTLTYDDFSVPKLFFTPDREYLYNHQDNLLIPVSSVRNPLDDHWFLQKKYFEYCRYKDFQDFIKRLRQWFLRHVPEKELVVKSYVIKNGKESPIYETFRYYGVSELGPLTVRPHFHFICYFNSKYFAEHFEQAFSEAWSYYNRHTRRRYSKGVRSQCRPCNGAEDRYTAAYCDAVVGIPLLYQRKEIRPRHSYSRLPSLGCLEWNFEDSCQKIHSGALRSFDGLDKQGSPVVRPFPLSLERQLFPKCPSFHTLSERSRMRCYKVYEIIISRYYDGEFIDYNNFAFFCLQFWHKFWEFIPDLQPYISRQVQQKLDGSSIDRPFYQLYLSSRRFLENCIKYGLSASTYLRMLEEYYSLKEYYRLRDHFEFLEEASQTEDVRYYYSLFYNTGPKLKSRYPFYKSHNFLDMVSTYNKIHADMTKSRKERDYQHKENAVVYDPQKTLMYGS